MKVTVYGIPNCNTVKKTMDWLNAHKVDFDFHNFKKDGITKTKLNAWAKQVGWETLLNKKGTTWRKLTEEEQQSATNTKNVVELLASHTSMIKRPVITVGEEVKLLGFDEEALKGLS